jgi:hypothetical protein
MPKDKESIMSDLQAQLRAKLGVQTPPEQPKSPSRPEKILSELSSYAESILRTEQQSGDAAVNSSD